MIAIAALLCLVQSPDLEKGIKAKEVEVRLATVQLLAKDRDPKTERLLVAATHDEDWEVALRATEAFAERGGKGAVDALVKLSLDAPILRIRHAAARALAAIAADEAAATLVKKTNGDDAHHALEALAIVLAGKDSKLDLSGAAKAAEKSKDSELRAAGAAVVAAGGWKERDKILDRILDTGGVRAVCAALDTLTAVPRAGDLVRVMKLLQKPQLDDCVERRALAAARAGLYAPISGLDEAKILETLAPLLSAKDAQVSARGARLVERLSALPGAVDTSKTGVAALLAPDKAYLALEPALTHADPAPRAAAAKALARIGGVPATERARAMTKGDKSPRVRHAALEALCQLASVAEEPNRVVALAVLANDADPDMRRLAAVRLGKKGLAEAVDPLVAALTDKDWGVAVCAAVSLGKTQSGSAIEPLTKLSKTATDWKLRAAAIVGLSRMYLKSAIPPVIDALSDADAYVVQSAHAYLYAVSKEKFPAKKEPWLEWWEKNKDRVIVVDPASQEEYRKRFGDRGTGAPEIFRDMDVLVLESRGDHIENVLDGQKIPHRRTIAGKLATAGLCSDALFVANCTGEIEENDVERLRWFVLAGGHLFGSCWALHETIERALPGVLAKQETASEVLAIVEARACEENSPYLDGVFTEGAQPMYALEGAHLIDVIDPERAQVLIDSPEAAEEFGCGNMAAWFSAGHGTVLDSVNHFEAQGLENAQGLKKPIDRQAYAVDHMGLALDKLRAIRAEPWWDNNAKASKEITDLSVFRLVTNFVRLRRLAL